MPKKKEVAEMKHRHKYETVTHHGITSELMELGIQAAEVRKCVKCEKEMPFVLTKKGWFPLFTEREADEKDILLA